MHLKKRYKYYCKKHDTTYLIQSTRLRAKEASKENRNKFIQCFRTLKVSTDSHNDTISENSICTTNKYKSILKEHQVIKYLNQFLVFISFNR
jgi:hypothetical protein